MIRCQVAQNYECGSPPPGERVTDGPGNAASLFFLISIEDEDGETPLERATYACRLRYAMSEEELAMLERLLEGAEDATVVEG